MNPWIRLIIYLVGAPLLGGVLAVVGITSRFPKSPYHPTPLM